MAYFFLFNPINTEDMILVMNSTIIRILLFLLGEIFPFYFAYFVSPLFSTMHTHCLSNREKKKKGTSFCFKEVEEEEDKETGSISR